MTIFDDHEGGAAQVNIVHEHDEQRADSTLRENRSRRREEAEPCFQPKIRLHMSRRQNISHGVAGADEPEG